ncbi:hypothetical protein C2G38_2252178 [Gigaspora rosea]|uniref:Uncharacterized protein n=1 Tax=Gigaspora rosea TaxID=44941 RepID=A0A397UDE0_9GLOM|nr:hypothetical protein C2G38_2252178 [Gigaspora rosea]
MKNLSICERTHYREPDYVVDRCLLSEKDKNWASKHLYYNRSESDDMTANQYTTNIEVATKLFERLSNNYLELINDKEDFNEIISTALKANNNLTPKLPSRATEPRPTVINERHAAEIASWVDK